MRIHYFNTQVIFADERHRSSLTVMPSRPFFPLDGKRRLGHVGISCFRAVARSPNGEAVSLLRCLLGASQQPCPYEETHDDYNEADMMESEKRDFALQFMRSLGWTGTFTGNLTQERPFHLTARSSISSLGRCCLRLLRRHRPAVRISIERISILGPLGAPLTPWRSFFKHCSVQPQH